MLFIELECVPQFWVRKMGMAWGPRGVASPVFVASWQRCAGNYYCETRNSAPKSWYLQHSGICVCWKPL